MQVKKGHPTFPEVLRGRQTSGGDNRSGCRKNGKSDMIWLFKKNSICFSENWVCTESEACSMKGHMTRTVVLGTREDPPSFSHHGTLGVTAVERPQGRQRIG